MTRRIWLLMAIIALAGCGPSEGDRYVLPRSTEIYFHKSDAEDGGKDKWWTHRDRMAYVDSSNEVKIIEVGKPWIKVEVTSGRDTGTSGWMEAKGLGEKR